MYNHVHQAATPNEFGRIVNAFKEAATHGDREKMLDTELLLFLYRYKT